MTDAEWLEHAWCISARSPDPNTRVGAVLVWRDGRQLLGDGYNRMPSGIADTCERWNDRELKLSLVIHAEIAAVWDAIDNGQPVSDSTLYMVATDSSGARWGGAPCIRCAGELIHAGIRRIVTLPRKTTPSQWAASIDQATALLAEAGVELVEIE